MNYTASEATRLDVYRGESLQQQRRATLRTVDGEGADAKVRAGVSAEFLSKLKVFFAVLGVVGVLCVARVGTFAVAASIMADNATMRTQIEESTTLANQLRIQRSVLSSTSRIDRIATQSYGMVAAESTEQMTAGATSVAAEEASAEDAAEQETSEQAAEQTQASEAKSSEEVAADISQAEITQGDGSTAGANAADVDSIS